MNSKYIKVLPPMLFFLLICTLIVLADFRGTQYVLGLAPKVPYGDKLGHLILFGLLAFLINQSLNFKFWSLRNIKFYWGSLMVMGFAIIEEFSQIGLQTRTFEILDLLADLVGVWLISSTFMRAAFRKMTRIFQF